MSEIPPKRRRLPRDPNQRAKAIVELATGERDETRSIAEDDAEPDPDEKNPAAVALGRLGGKKGGAARAAALTPERRREIARKAAKARWAKDE